ncbi:MAG: hypothetical protein WAZ18_00070 [Alphaproteobacteria bacterium]
MKHDQAISIFQEIQARPYRVSEKINTPANNCYFKGIELLQRLGSLGYTVRGRVGETAWDNKLITAEILNLYDVSFKVTHFVTEIHLNGRWRFLDPSYPISLRKHGFKVGSWDKGTLCFPITKLYMQKQSLEYQQEWFSPGYAESYFKKNAPFFKAFNAWISKFD